MFIDLKISLLNPYYKNKHKDLSVMVEGCKKNTKLVLHSFFQYTNMLQ